MENTNYVVLKTLPGTFPCRQTFIKGWIMKSVVLVYARVLPDLSHPLTSSQTSILTVYSIPCSEASFSGNLSDNTFNAVIWRLDGTLTSIRRVRTEHRLYHRQQDIYLCRGGRNVNTSSPGGRVTLIASVLKRRYVLWAMVIRSENGLALTR